MINHIFALYRFYLNGSIVRSQSLFSKLILCSFTNIFFCPEIPIAFQEKLFLSQQFRKTNYYVNPSKAAIRATQPVKTLGSRID